MLACSLWLATFGCCAAGLVVTLAVTRPLTVGVLADGAAYRAGLPARLRHRRAGAGPAAAGQPDRLAVRRLRAGLGADHPHATLGRPAGPRSPARCRWSPSSPPCSGSSTGRRRSPSGSPCRPCWCPTGGCGRAAGGRWWPPPWSGRSMALVGGSLLPGTAAGDRVPDRQPVRAGRGGRHGRRRWSASLGLVLHWLACLLAAWSAWCCGSGPPAGSSASSCAGSPPGPPAPWPGCWPGLAARWT